MKIATLFQQLFGLRLVFVFAIALAFTGCKKNEDPQPEDTFSQEIKRNIPESTIDKLREMGLSVHEGTKPPKLEATYWMSPRIMTKTWVPNDYFGAGEYFSDMKFSLYNQDDKKLTISLDYNEYSRNTGSLITDAEGKDGAFISGSGKYFTVFVVSEGTYVNKTTRFKMLEVFSGEIAADGIKNLQTGLVMMDNYGNINNDLIPNDTGRTFEDEDGFTETTSPLRLGLRTAAGENTTPSGAELKASK